MCKTSGVVDGFETTRMKARLMSSSGMWTVASALALIHLCKISSFIAVAIHRLTFTGTLNMNRGSHGL